MSVIAVKVEKNKIVIGSDSASTKGSQQIINTNNDNNGHWCKLVKVKNMIVGGVGSSKENFQFQIFCKTHEPKDETTESISDFIVEFSEWYHTKTKNYDLNKYEVVYWHHEAIRDFNNKVFFEDIFTPTKDVGKTITRDFTCVEEWLKAGNRLKPTLKNYEDTKPKPILF